MNTLLFILALVCIAAAGVGAATALARGRHARRVPSTGAFRGRILELESDARRLKRATERARARELTSGDEAALFQNLEELHVEISRLRIELLEESRARLEALRESEVALAARDAAIAAALHVAGQLAYDESTPQRPFPDAPSSPADMDESAHAPSSADESLEREPGDR